MGNITELNKTIYTESKLACDEIDVLPRSTNGNKNLGCGIR